MRKDEAGADVEDLSITPIYEAGRTGKFRPSESVMALPRTYD